MTKLERLEAALAAATEGPWKFNTPCLEGSEFEKYHRDLFNRLEGELVAESTSVIQSWDYEGYSSGIYIRKADAELIALLRNLAPDLVRVVRLAHAVLYANDTMQNLKDLEKAMQPFALDESVKNIKALGEALAPLVEGEPSSASKPP